MLNICNVKGIIFSVNSVIHSSYQFGIHYFLIGTWHQINYTTAQVEVNSIEESMIIVFSFRHLVIAYRLWPTRASRDCIIKEN